MKSLEYAELKTKVATTNEQKNTAEAITRFWSRIDAVVDRALEMGCLP